MFEQDPAGQESQHEAQLEPDTAFLKEISTAALVDLLIKKGIVNPAELLQQERELRYVSADTGTARSYRKKKHGEEGLLRRWASRRRWSRRLTTALFRWKWKKVHHENRTVEPT